MTNVSTAGLFVIVALSGALCGAAQGHGGRELAVRLADPTTRQAAITEVVANARADVPLLLSWTRSRPNVADNDELSLAMAQVFGRLKTVEAIPFLIKNITLQGWPASPNTWTKTPEVIESRVPAVAALIQIGPVASRALLHVPFQQMTPEDRVAVVFTVGQIPGVPEAREFLANVGGQANVELFWADEGLKHLDDRR